MSETHDVKRITTPLSDETIASLKAGDAVRITGVLYTARDAAHRRLVESLKKVEKPPFPLEGQVIYYVGPSPAREGMVIGSAGPTTAGRMDAYTPYLLSLGVRGFIGKGKRNAETKEAFKKYRGIYFAAIGGAAAYLSKTIRKAEIIAYPELGTEAIRRLEVEDFPAYVIHDIHGGDLYAEGIARYSEQPA